MEESEKVIQGQLEGEGKGPRIKILTPLQQEGEKDMCNYRVV